MHSSRRARLRVGTSGWQYRHWKGLFYPDDLRQADWFDWYARHFDTVEINNSFYRLPSAETFAAWRARAPRGFLYAVKFSRYGTHLKHLRDPEGPIDLFLERAIELRSMLGPILVQLPPRWRVDAPRLEAFLAEAPARHRWAIELRHPSWLCDEVFAVLERHGAALVVHDLLPDHPHVITTSWTYRRYHGTVPGGRYGAARMRAEAQRLAGILADGIDVYAYFNNDLGGHAIRDAMSLARHFIEPRDEARAAHASRS